MILMPKYGATPRYNHQLLACNNSGLICCTSTECSRKHEHIYILFQTSRQNSFRIENLLPVVCYFLHIMNMTQVVFVSFVIDDDDVLHRVESQQPHTTRYH
ncbi:hypothetical protein NP493_765g01059 [Ridgeia piscesae]|uniref:Uncharacterized protein n=1 Tax=Ridgeia piscesae TaxID=27915 RepID=A0AAD9KP76_RIDPI|nr:hypothetical protein NP493_765g01059 [Ridgeia piscesae]